MFVWVIYDISDNKLRKRISDKCKDFGLERLQRSAFFGELSFNSIEMLRIDIEDIFENGDKSKEDCVFILPVCKKCISRKMVIGKSFNEKEFEEKFYIFYG